MNENRITNVFNKLGPSILKTYVNIIKKIDINKMETITLLSKFVNILKAKIIKNNAIAAIKRNGNFPTIITDMLQYFLFLAIQFFCPNLQHSQLISHPYQLLCGRELKWISDCGLPLRQQLEKTC